MQIGRRGWGHATESQTECHTKDGGKGELCNCASHNYFVTEESQNLAILCQGGQNIGLKTYI
jgi:hypothetical protein